MPTHSSATELRKMSAQDLRKEIADKHVSLAKMKLDVEMRTEKDTAKLRREKKDLARLLTVLGEVENGAKNSSNSTLKAKRKASTVPASK